MIIRIEYKDEENRNLLEETRRADELFLDTSKGYMELLAHEMYLWIPLSNILHIEIKKGQDA